MNRAIVLEAFKVVVALRWAAVRGEVPAAKATRVS